MFPLIPTFLNLLNPKTQRKIKDKVSSFTGTSELKQDDGMELRRETIDKMVSAKKEAMDNAAENASGHEELPQRRYNKLYRELWQNRVVFGRKK